MESKINKKSDFQKPRGSEVINIVLSDYLPLKRKFFFFFTKAIIPNFVAMGLTNLSMIITKIYNLSCSNHFFDVEICLCGTYQDRIITYLNDFIAYWMLFLFFMLLDEIIPKLSKIICFFLFFILFFFLLLAYARRML